MSFDISSTTIGIGYFKISNKIELINAEYIKPSKKGRQIQNLSETKKIISEKIKKFKPNECVIEDIMLYGTLSTALTITTLAVWNRTIGLECYDITKKLPQFVPVNAARSVIYKKAEELKPDFPFILNKKGWLDKMGVPGAIEIVLNEKLKPILKKKSTNFADEYYDVADGIAIGLGWYLMGMPDMYAENDLKKAEKSKKVKKKKKKELDKTIKS